MSRGKDGVENFVKVGEGRYRDAGGDGPTSMRSQSRAQPEVMRTFFRGGSRDALPGS